LRRRPGSRHLLPPRAKAFPLFSELRRMLYLFVFAQFQQNRFALLLELL
jgi:hypothetical protein